MNVHRGPVSPPLSGEHEMSLYQEPEDSSFNIRAYIGTIWRGKWTIAICIAIALVMGLLAVSQLKPTYKASAKVLFESERTNITNLEDVVVSPEFSRDTLENEIQILTSTSLIGRVVDTLNLDRHPEFNPALGDKDRSILDILRSLLNWRTYVSPQLLADLGIIEAPVPVARDPELAAHRQRLSVIGRVLAGLSLRPIPGSRVIEISFEGRTPTMAARIVNTLAEQYIVNQLDAKLTATRKASEWLADRTDQLGERLREAELAVEEARAELADESGQSTDITQQQLAELNGALAGARATRARLEVQYKSVSAALADESVDLGAVSLFRDAPVIQRLRQEESDLRSRDAALAAMAKSNPRRVQIAVRLADIQDNIRQEAERITAALEASLEDARNAERTLEAEVRKLEATEQEQRTGEVKLRQLERQAQASRVLYESFLGRLEETSQQESLQTANVRILSPAEIPTSPEATYKNRILIAALLLGGAAGVGVVFLLDRLNNTFRGVDQVQLLTGLPVLASLPSVGSRVARADVVKDLRDRPNGPLAEAVRNMRTSVLFSPSGVSPKVVMFTSSTPREGKSTSAFLMALTSQQMGRSAIIVDCDLRLHALSSLVREDNDKPGLLAVIDGEATIGEALHIDPATGLHILTAQPSERGTPLSAADTVSSQGFATLVGQLSRAYDLVILDTPPVLVVTDPRIVGRLADAIVYAVRWDFTPRGAVQEGLREMRSVSAPLAGIVLTMVDSERVASYAYESYGYYRSRYMDYYS